MKKNVVSVFVFLILSTCLSSCSGGSGDPENFALQDAFAAYAFVESVSAAPISYSCPECVAAIAVAVGLAESEATSRISNQGSIGYAEITKTLPQAYLVDGNPYECMGQVHNSLLFIFTKEDRVEKITALKNGDDASILSVAEKYMKCASISANLTDNIVQLMKSTFKDPGYTNSRKYFQHMSRGEILNTMALSGNPNTLYLVGIVYDVESLKGRGKIAVVNYLNTKINEVVVDEELSGDSKFHRLTFLSIFKHSYYFWEN